MALSTGDVHSLAIREDRKLYAWGNNDCAQLGIGNSIHYSGAVPVAFPDGVGVVEISGGSGHTLAIGSDGKIYSWGCNGAGQLGYYSMDRYSYTQPHGFVLDNGATPLAISAGWMHSLALGNDGKIYAWGSDFRGQLGNGPETTSDFMSPVMVSLPGGVDAVAIYAGYMHSLAIGSDGKVYAWGWNTFGALGDGSSTDRHTPVPISLASGVNAVAVSAGQSHSLAIGSDGKVYAWGRNHDGQVGDGSGNSVYRPVALTLAEGVSAVAIDAGSYHSLAIGSDGKLYAWGLNHKGQLGDGSTISRSTPVSIALVNGVKPIEISGGWGHTLALGSDGHFYSWGYNEFGQLGDKSSDFRNTPSNVLYGNSQPLKTAPTVPFSDTIGNLLSHYIQAIYEAGITTGCGNNNYCPTQTVNRQQMAAFLIRAMEGEPALDYCGTTSPFSDVVHTAAMCRYIKRLVELDVTTGCGNGNYCPTQTVNRQQMAAFIVRAVDGEPPLDYCGTTDPFSDVPYTSAMCRYIKRLAELGVTTGCGGGNYCPTGLVNRQQMAAFLARAFLGM